ncbi:MAG: glycosyl hydrolase family 18 protein [Candidatus Omnitrophota bacterium]|nr:hypothetical protein [Candidatus Omnitrophota bacterium]
MLRRVVLVIGAFLVGCILVMAGISMILAQEAQSESEFIISAWIPNENVTSGVEAFNNHSRMFNQISPIVFEVDRYGIVQANLEISAGQGWDNLFEKSVADNILVIPTVFWNDTVAINTTLVNLEKRREHSASLVRLIDMYDLKGIDINYQKKSPSSAAFFSDFIIGLSGVLKEKGCLLSCSIEPRTSDKPPDGVSREEAFAWANDYEVLNKYCDYIRILAFDMSWQGKPAVSWEGYTDYPYAPCADINSVEEVIKYTLTKIDASKLVLGIPTYGWELEVNGIYGSWSYRRNRQLNMPEAMEVARSNFEEVKRQETGELAFNYEKRNHFYYVSFPDSESIREKIELARLYDIKGVIFFRLDGSWEDGLWKVLGDRH